MHVAVCVEVVNDQRDKRVVAVSESIDRLEARCQEDVDKYLVDLRWKEYMGFLISQSIGDAYQTFWYHILEIEYI